MREFKDKHLGELPSQLQSNLQIMSSVQVQLQSEQDALGRAEQQKTYLITARGRAELGEWLHMPPGLAPPPRDELVTKVLVAVRVPGTDVHEVIQAHRRQVVELMQEWTQVKEEQAEFDLPLALVIDSELTRLGAVAKWLDLADEHVRHAAAEPAPARGGKLRRRVVVRR